MRLEAQEKGNRMARECGRACRRVCPRVTGDFTPEDSSTGTWAVIIHSFIWKILIDSVLDCPWS